MALRHLGFVELPPHIKPGGFDHAAVHWATNRVYVAHTGNDALDVIDCINDQYLHSIPNLTGVAGALVANERDLVLTSNRGENTVGVFTPDDEASIVKVNVGVRPNGLAYDPVRNLLLVANVGDVAIPGSFTVSLVDVTRRTLATSVPMPGRTRWTVYDPCTDRFIVNIMEPAQIVVVDASNLERAHVTRIMYVPASGPHGLELDQQRLFCACDGRKIITLVVDSGQVIDVQDISGAPDVIFFNKALAHLYVAIGDPGVIEVFDTTAMHRVESVATEKGAHTLAFDSRHNKVYAFCSETCRAAVYADEG